MFHTALIDSGGAVCRFEPRKEFRVFPNLHGHVWTLRAGLPALSRVREPSRPEIFTTTVKDDRFGAVRLHGLYQESAGADELLLIVHGLGADATSSYCLNAARVAQSTGISSLRISMRGADLSGEDIYHAGLSSDLADVLRSPRLDLYRKIYILGYSMGGHLALRAALDLVDSRLRAVAAVCPPLDLEATMNVSDAPSRRLYRYAICSALNRCYAMVERRGRACVPLEVVKRAKRCSEWNALAIVPRFGFSSVEEYYRKASVAGWLYRLETPSLLIACEQDPIVPKETVESATEDASPALTVRWSARGGHVRMPQHLDLGFPGPLGLEQQIIAWLRWH
jgi:predicted alpha/beta-fold hydrolase